MTKIKGFTLIEIMIIAAILAILAAIIIPIFDPDYESRLKETKCVAGYVFVNRPDGRQIMDENGRGIKCDMPVNGGQ